MKTLTDLIWLDKFDNESIEESDPHPVLVLSCDGIGMGMGCSIPPQKQFP